MINGFAPSNCFHGTQQISKLRFFYIPRKLGHDKEIMQAAVTN